MDNENSAIFLNLSLFKYLLIILPPNAHMLIEGIFWEAVKSADGTWNLTSTAKMKLQDHRKGGGNC